MLEWGKMWTSESSRWDNLKIVRVGTEFNNGEKIHIANATNGRIWLRRPLNFDVPDGAYSIGLDGGLTLIQNFRGSYPDLGLLLPDFSNMETLGKFNVADLTTIAYMCQKVISVDRDGFVGFGRGIVGGVVRSHHLEEEDDDGEGNLVHKYTVTSLTGIPTEETIEIPVQSLTIAVNEMLHYQDMEFYMMRERPVENDEKAPVSPIVIGTSPYSCAILGTDFNRPFGG